MLSRQLAAALAAIAAWTLFRAGALAQPPQSPPDPTEEHLEGTGSGFVLTSGGYVVTNHHVVEGATSLGVLIPGKEKAVVAKVVVDDPEDDLAIVKVDGPLGNPPIAFADPRQVKVGEDVFVLGYPRAQFLGETVR